MEQGRSEAVFKDEISAADKEPEQGRSGELWGFMMSPLPFFGSVIIEPASFLLLCFPILLHFSPLCLFLILRSALCSDPPYAQIHLILRPLLVSYHFFPGIFVSTSGKDDLFDKLLRQSENLVICVFAGFLQRMNF